MISGHLNAQLKGDEELYLKQRLLVIECQLKHPHKKKRGESENKALTYIKTIPKAFKTFAKESTSVQ